ncbi:DeoR/GlpR family DNA-binding transcription regulator [Vibrio salinus]|uniref:DeoR/GlpR family DNA-binding transcription regulator n=1 Tax=Vibrio salinus TaxID=2899784 RepID=UPI001E51407E|nr:DeoR/GlpR family DNA-binding transcription regulator [Vibrio salinus]MCE0492410.1 DeoR/GlpR family DNA-binding transcription regulator [Vibrio salinus]
MNSSRDTWILEKLSVKGTISVKDIAEQHNISLESARRDLRRLSKTGALIRTHGGAISKNKSDVGHSFQSRQRSNTHPKKSLAENVVKHIYEGSIIGLDASSTSWYFAQLMPDIPCTVITNSMYNVQALAEKKNIEIIATGGVFSEKYFGFYGPLAERMLNQIHIDVGIFSCVGLDNEGNIWESNELNASIKKKFMRVCERKFLLADSSKFGKRNLIQLAPLSEFDTLFVEKKPNVELVNYAQENGVAINFKS